MPRGIQLPWRLAGTGLGAWLLSDRPEGIPAPLLSCCVALAKVLDLSELPLSLLALAPLGAEGITGGKAVRTPPHPWGVAGAQETVAALSPLLLGKAQESKRSDTGLALQHPGQFPSSPEPCRLDACPTG